jgi:hypothetical protein
MVKMHRGGWNLIGKEAAVFGFLSSGTGGVLHLGEANLGGSVGGWRCWAGTRAAGSRGARGGGAHGASRAAGGHEQMASSGRGTGRPGRSSSRRWRCTEKGGVAAGNDAEGIGRVL